ncbi:class I SAM-dependent methyltransferase [Patescibacteria group bacterium]|nr:class I SAM-dependent methyltransferase [Patescibacteria group bacterium]
MNIEAHPDDETQAHWEAKMERGWREGYGPDEELMDFIEKNREEFGEEILDIGCGNGRNLVPLAEKGFKMSGVDIAQAGIDKTKERLDKQNLDAVLKQGKTIGLPFEDKSFDSLYTIGTFHHNIWEEIKKSFEEANRVLRDNGFFFFHARSINDTSRPREAIDDEKEIGFTAKDTSGGKQGVIQHYFTEDELKMLANDHGFEIVVPPHEEFRQEPDDPDPEHKRARIYTVFKKVK